MSPMCQSSESLNARVRGGGRRFSADLRFLVLLSAVVLAGGCRQDMQNQPKMKPFRSTTFFSDKLSMRPPVAGTVPRGFLRVDAEFFTGKKKTSPAAPTSAASAAAFADDITVLPIPVTTEVLNHGKERFEIFCSVCHGLTGYGDGMIVRRGFRRAASFH